MAFAYENMLKKAVEILFDSPASMAMKRVETVLNLSLDFFQVDRMTLCRLNDDRNVDDAIVVSNPGIPLFSTDFRNYINGYIDRLRDGVVVFQDDGVDNLMNKDEQHATRMDGVLAHLLIPLKSQGTVWGALSVSRFKQHDGWDSQIIERLKMFASMCGMAYQRHIAWRDMMVLNTELLELSQNMMTTVENERSELARELHDNFSQRMAIVSVKAQGLKLKLPEGSARDDAISIHHSVRDLASDIQALSRSLHPQIIEDLGLAAAVKAECRRVAELRNTEVQVVVNEIGEPDITISLQLYRSLQEVLLNSIKHSEAENIFVMLSYEDNRLTLRIIDDGIGFDVAEAHRKGSVGLVSIRERARKIKGKADIISAVGDGTEVVIKGPKEVL